MYSERLRQKIQTIVKKWSGKEGELSSLSIHNLICALNQDAKEYGVAIPLISKKED